MFVEVLYLIGVAAEIRASTRSMCSESERRRRNESGCRRHNDKIQQQQRLAAAIVDDHTTTTAVENDRSSGNGAFADRQSGAYAFMLHYPFNLY